MNSQEEIREAAQSEVYDSKQVMKSLSDAIENADCCESEEDLNTNIDDAISTAKALLVKLNKAKKLAARLK